MAGAVHGTGEPDEVINVGISGPGVVRAVVDSLPRDADLTAIAEAIKAHRVQDHARGRARRPRGRQTPRRARWASSTSRWLPRPPRATRWPRSSRRWVWAAAADPAPRPRSPCSTTRSRRAARWARRAPGGLSGAFIPVSEDQGMIRAAESGALSIEKLEAMTAVCSVGLDMIAIPGDTTSRDDRRHHRRRVRHRHRQLQDDRRAPHPGHRQAGGRPGLVRRASRRGAGDGRSTSGRGPSSRDAAAGCLHRCSR